MLKIIVFLDKLFKFIGFICALSLVLIALLIIFNVIMRYVFNDVSIALQELEWHLFSITFLFGISYALRYNSHVRVDFLYEKFSIQTKAIINIFGSIIFVIPLAYLIAYYGFGFALEAYNIGEKSGDPGGLTNRWIIKSVISVSFFLVILSAIHMIINNLNIILHSYGSEELKRRLCFEIDEH